jgi:SET domain-containing protein
MSLVKVLKKKKTEKKKEINDNRLLKKMLESSIYNNTEVSFVRFISEQKGFGTFATRDIVVGEKIIDEEPLVNVQNSQNKVLYF